MDDEDEIVVNDDGCLDVRYRGWTSFDPEIWSLSKTILTLDVSFNCLESLPQEIGRLSQLHTLDCSCNRIRELPDCISKLRRLKTIRANSNRLKSIPYGIGNCRRVEVIILSENAIETLPDSLGECQNLREIDLKNNHLIHIPLTLANLSDTIERIDVSHNTKLSAIPEKIRNDTEVIMWLLNIHHKNSNKVNEIKLSMKEMENLCLEIKEETISVNNSVQLLEAERRGLVLELESHYRYLLIRDFVRRMLGRTKMLWSSCKKIFDKGTAKIGASDDVR